MSRIQILPPEEADRIAAGEVVERPASVARELVENALDAGARRIEVEAVRGGLQRLRVADDGEGMGPEDAVLALRRHATSKIRSLEDLSRASTLGFRGEALPSVAAVSRLELLTSDGESGVRVRVEGGRVLGSEPAARARGTTVTVDDLFFNTPARRKFLRSPAAELARISEALLPEILARPAIAFRFRSDGRETLDVPPGEDRAGRAAALWGAELAAALIPFRREAGGRCVHGFLSGPGQTRATRRHWYLFVNGRPVRDRVLIHAAGAGLEGALPRGRYPVLLLFLEVSPAEVDVNVHPAKSEVRFAEPGRIHTLVSGALAGAVRPAAYIPAGPRPSTLLGEPPPAGGGAGEGRQPDALPPRAGRLFTPAELPERPAPGSAPVPGEVAPVVLAQYRDCFIVAHDAGSLFLVDQHVAHERILYEELRDQWRQGVPARQALLFPQTVELEPGAADGLEPALEQLGALGFDLERFGGNAFLVRQVPQALAPGRVEQAFRDLAALLASGPEEGGEPRQAEDLLHHRLAATIACHAAVKIHFPLTREKMEDLLRRLFICREPLTCPHGRTVVTRWPHEEILRAFGRL